MRNFILSKSISIRIVVKISSMLCFMLCTGQSFSQDDLDELDYDEGCDVAEDAGKKIPYLDSVGAIYSAKEEAWGWEASLLRGYKYFGCDEFPTRLVGIAIGKSRGYFGELEYVNRSSLAFSAGLGPFFSEKDSELKGIQTTFSLNIYPTPVLVYLRGRWESSGSGPFFGELGCLIKISLLGIFNRLF